MNSCIHATKIERVKRVMSEDWLRKMQKAEMLSSTVAIFA